MLASVYILKSDCVNGLANYTYSSAAGVHYQQRNYVIKGRTKRKKKCPLKKSISSLERKNLISRTKMALI